MKKRNVSPELRAEIKDAEGTHREIAERFKVSVATVGRIRKGLSGTKAGRPRREDSEMAGAGKGLADALTQIVLVGIRHELRRILRDQP